MVRALELLASGVKEGWARAIPYGYINTQLGTGLFGFAVGSSAGLSFYAQEARFKLGVSTLPGRLGDSLVQGTNLVLFRSAAPDQKRIAARFLEYASSPTVQAEFARATGYAPVNLRSYGLLPHTGPLSIVVAQTRSTRFEPVLANWENVRAALGKAVKDAVAGRATPEAALGAAQGH